MKLHAKVLYIFVISLALFYLSPAYPLTNHPYSKTEEQKAFRNLIQDFINEMDLKYGLICTGDGSSGHDKITSISLMLDIHRRASLEEAREIHIEAKERLIEMIHQNPKIQSYLSMDPFPKINIKLSIIYGPDERFCYCDGTIAGTIEGQGTICYLGSEVLNPRLLDLYEEPYEEALKIVRTNPLQQDMYFHKEIGFEKEIDRVMMDFIRQSYKKYNIQCDGFGGKMVDGIDKIELSFVRQKKTSVTEARKMQVDLTQTFLDMINKSKTLAPYLKHRPFNEKYLNIRVLFKNGREGLFGDGSLSRMLQEDGIIHYLNEKSPKRRIMGWIDGNRLFDETFEEAVLKAGKKVR